MYKAFLGIAMSVHSEMKKVPNTGIMRFFKKYKTVPGERNVLSLWVQEHDAGISENPEMFMYQDEFFQKWLFNGMSGNIMMFKAWPLSSEIPIERYEGRRILLYAAYKIL